MERSLKINLIQTDTIWENIGANLKNLSSKIDGLKEETDVIILPELFTTGFYHGGRWSGRRNGWEGSSLDAGYG